MLRSILVLAAVASLVACTAATLPPSPSLPGSTTSVEPLGSPSPLITGTSPANEVPTVWSAAGRLAASARQARAIALANGGALVIGYAEETASMTAEIWDPATGSWRLATPLERPRTGFAAVALHDGRVLVAGGFNENGESYSSSYIYDPATDAWTKTGLMHTARTNPAAAVLPDGRVLVAGGYFYTGFEDAVAPVALAAYRPTASAASEPSRPPLDDVDMPDWGYALATVEVFDPASGMWAQTGPMKFARSGAAAATLADGHVLVVGSSDDNVSRIDGRAYSTAEVYDPVSGRFELTGSLPDIDRGVVADLGVVLPETDPEPASNGTLVSVGNRGAVLLSHAEWWKHEGDIVRSFRYVDGLWSPLGDPFAWVENHDTETLSETATRSRFGAAVVALEDGRVLVAGGSPRYQSASPAVATAELLDPSTDTFSALVDMPEPRDKPLAVLLADGSALIIAGQHDTFTDASGWNAVELLSAVRFDPELLDR
jgi:hypothetical protein